MNSNTNPLKYIGQNYTFVPTFKSPRDPGTADVKSQDGNYFVIPSFWKNTTNGNLWQIVNIANNAAVWNLISATSESPVLGINVDLTTTLTPENGIINVLHDSGIILKTYSPSTLAIQSPTVTPVVVDQTVGPYKTISDAIQYLNDSGGGGSIYINPGTYTENIVLSNAINLVAFGFSVYPYDTSTDPAHATPFDVVISGTVSISDDTTCQISGVVFKSTYNTPFISLNSSGSVLKLYSCTLLASQYVPIELTNSSTLVCEYCNGDLSGSATHFFDATNSTIRFINCRLTNSTNQTAANTLVSTVAELSYTYFQSPLVTSGTSALLIRYSTLPMSTINQTCVTAGGSGTHRFFWSYFDGGTATALSVNNTTILRNCSVASTINAAIAGTGTVQYTPITFTSNAASITTTNQTPVGSIGPYVTLNSVTAGNGAGAQLLCGDGSPNGAVSAKKGSIYLNTSATTTTSRVWINTDGATTWASITTSS